MDTQIVLDHFQYSLEAGTLKVGEPLQQVLYAAPLTATGVRFLHRSCHGIAVPPAKKKSSDFPEPTTAPVLLKLYLVPKGVEPTNAHLYLSSQADPVTGMVAIGERVIPSNYALLAQLIGEAGGELNYFLTVTEQSN